ncbi:hypothetical protein R3P38DRAFT_230647 [Favolaschia claudopus]|uniref:Uncharacterized protein n=1 Tax=Favolaschia claudopus TaxID=2862362 RepID=A0AAV9ZSB4_9AGAR
MASIHDMRIRANQEPLAGITRRSNLRHRRATNSSLAVPLYNSSSAPHLSTVPFATYTAPYGLPTTTYAPGLPAPSARRAYESQFSVQATQPSSSSNTSTWRSRATSSSVPRVAASVTPNFGWSKVSHPQARGRSISIQQPDYPSSERSIHRSLSTYHPPSMSTSIYVSPSSTYPIHVPHDNPSVQSVSMGHGDRLRWFDPLLSTPFRALMLPRHQLCLRRGADLPPSPSNPQLRAQSSQCPQLGFLRPLQLRC